jgi:flagellar basal body-associated protein FliL
MNPMADAKDKKDAPPAKSSEAEPKKKGSKAPLAVAAVMLIEGVGVFLVARMTSPKPAEAATEVAVQGEGHGEATGTVEVPLIEDKFQNMQTGQVWIWDAEIVLKVKKKNEEAVSKVLESKAAEIKEGVAAIFRRAQLSQLKEPGLETLNRQVSTYVNQVLGKDPEGHSRVERVLIPRCRGYNGL